MQEFAPKHSRPWGNSPYVVGTRPPEALGNCPSDLELAAYIDGALGKEDAARVAKHLSSCDSCFETYTETLHFLSEFPPEESQHIDRAAAALQFPPDRQSASRATQVRRWIAIAAALLVAALGSYGYFVWQSSSASPPQIVVANVAPDLGDRPVHKILWDYNNYRGPGGSESKLARQSFQVGALLVDFHLNSRFGDATEASRIWQKIGVVLKDVPGMSDLSDRILNEFIQMSPEEPQVLRDITARLAQVETELRDSGLFDEYVDFGKWTEAGRIAALTQDASFFNSRENRRFLSYALETWKPEKPKEVQKKLQAIERLWERGDDLDPNSFNALAGHFQAILDHYDF